MSSPIPGSASVSRYADNTARLVPGLHDLHTMAGILLAERAPAEARVLVLGAGGGMELQAFAQRHAGWRFDGVDPSADMLRLARERLGPLASRVQWHEGYIDTAPEGPYDAASCLLTLHFLPLAARRQTLAQLHRRLKPGAPLVVAHHSFPTTDADKDLWLARYAAYAVASGAPAAQAQGSLATMKEKLPVLSPEQDAGLLQEAGFTDVTLFYCGLTFKGWAGYKA